MEVGVVVVVVGWQEWGVRGVGHVTRIIGLWQPSVHSNVPRVRRGAGGGRADGGMVCVSRGAGTCAGGEAIFGNQRAREGVQQAGNQR